MARIFETDRKMDASAMCMPGQVRRPKPNAIVCGSCSAGLLSVAMKRSGLKARGSEYVLGSCMMRLRTGEIDSE